MNSEQIREGFKNNPKLKRLVDWLIMNQVQTRPRWYVQALGGSLFCENGHTSLSEVFIRRL